MPGKVGACSWLLVILAVCAGCSSNGIPTNDGRRVSVGQPAADTKPLRRFPIFDTRSEPLPRVVLETLRSNHQHFEPNFAQRLTIIKSPLVWAVPNGEELCLASLQKSGVMGATCEPLRRALRNGLAATFLRDPTRAVPQARRTIVGIAPRGATRVSAAWPAGQASVPVVHGMFLHRDHIDQAPEHFALSMRKP